MISTNQQGLFAKRTLLLRFAFGFLFLMAVEIHANPKIIAHRGASEIAPENTIAAVKAAIEAKADWIEFDVRETADGELYLFHDADLKRFNGSKTKVASIQSTDCPKMDVGSWFDPKFANERPPHLRDVLKLCIEGGVVPLIEQKTGAAEKYIAVLRELEAVDKVVLQSFNWDFLEDAKQLEPTLILGALNSEPPTDEQWAKLEVLKPEWVGWNQKHLTEALVKDFQKRGFKVAVWTVNDLARLRKFVSYGVDGLITDRPGPARDVLD